MKTEILINATNTYNQLSIMEYAAKFCSVRTTIIGTIFLYADSFNCITMLLHSSVGSE